METNDLKWLKTGQGTCVFDGNSVASCSYIITNYHTYSNRYMRYFQLTSLQKYVLSLLKSHTTEESIPPGYGELNSKFQIEDRQATKQ